MSEEEIERILFDNLQLGSFDDIYERNAWINPQSVKVSAKAIKESLNVQGEGWRTGIPTKTGDYIVMFKNGNVFKYRFDSNNPKVTRQYKWKSIAYWMPLLPTPEEKCLYESDDTTGMNCKHCGDPKWVHEISALPPTPEEKGGEG